MGIKARWIAFFLLLSGLIPNLRAQLSTALLFRSGMVLQRQVDLPVWGSAGNGALVVAVINGTRDSTTADSGGAWELKLPAMGAGGPYKLALFSENDSLVYTDVYLGDVWLASGQSNMAMQLKDCDNAIEEIAGTVNPKIRQFNVNKVLGPIPRHEIPAGSEWTPATSDYVGEFSAVGYYFAKYLYNHLEVPVGIINSSYGGTRIESWMSEEMLGFDEQDIVFDDGQSWLQPTLAYNSMLHPLIKFPIKGVIWYQGESNMGSRETALMYTSQFKKLITSWRELWGIGDIPFLWVQIPNTGNEANEDIPGIWDALPMLREAQSRALSLSNTGEAVTIDTGEPDIHPTNKEPVGERLSLVARAVAYGDTIEYSGPRYKGHRKGESGKVEITFDHQGSGLVADGTEDNSLRWFSMAGSNGTFYRASAAVDSSRVVVWNNGIPNPEYIRYAYESNPFNVNLYNKEGLPAAPFKLRINPPGFHLEFFRSTDYAIDKGESAVITWQVYGSQNVRINQVKVDTVGGIRVWPTADSTFTLRMQSRDQPDHEESQSIRIFVQEPDPTITISTDAGKFIATGSQVIFRATVSAPDGGTVTRVEFLVNGTVIDTLTRAPFETRWIPDSAGTYFITGIVTNHRDMSKVSDSIQIVVDKFETLRFEAEDARITGRSWIHEDTMVSGGKYAELTRDWNVCFDSIPIKKDGQFQLAIAYMLNFGSPKVQHLYLNGEFVAPITFTSLRDDVWEKYFEMIPLKTGSNQIAIKGFWDLMSMDYIELLVKPDTTKVTGTFHGRFLTSTLTVYPNPFSTSTRIRFNLPENGPVKLEAYDLSGSLKGVIADCSLSAGIHEFLYNPIGFENGIYLLSLTYKNQKILKKIVVL